MSCLHHVLSNEYVKVICYMSFNSTVCVFLIMPVCGMLTDIYSSTIGQFFPYGNTKCNSEYTYVCGL